MKYIRTMTQQKLSFWLALSTTIRQPKGSVYSEAHA